MSVAMVIKGVSGVGYCHGEGCGDMQSQSNRGQSFLELR